MKSLAVLFCLVVAAGFLLGGIIGSQTSPALAGGISLPTENYGVFATTEHINFYTTTAGDVNITRCVLTMSSSGTASFWDYNGVDTWTRVIPKTIDAAADSALALTSTIFPYEFVFTSTTRPDLVYLTGGGSVFWE